MPYFVFSDGRDTFAVQIQDPALIAHARALIDGSITDSAHVGGIVTATPAEYNIGWSYQISPENVSFYDTSAEIGDAPIRDVEEFVNSARPVEDYLPHNFWGSWATFMVRELNTVDGSEFADPLGGTVAADIIFGYGGNDSLGGGGGSDFLVGGAGDDSLYGGIGHDKLGGGAGDDLLVGGDGGDVLDGGSGVDRLFGGSGNDTYIVESLEDMTLELTDGGVDLVKTSISLILRTNVERLKLLGAEDISGTGNSGDNVLIGNSGSNRLWGGAGDDVLFGDGGDDRVYSGDDRLDGGFGADRMHGGTGDDSYVVDNTGDAVIELEEAGTDRVYASISHSLRTNVEHLHLIGSSAINGAGNALSNVITGNSAANHLLGLGGDDILRGGGGNDALRGGAGNDILNGGGGNDRFVFDSKLGDGNVDHIREFEAGLDKIVLDDAAYAGLAPGGLSAAAFSLGTEASCPEQRIIYDPCTGALFFDKDGSGSGAAVQFAIIDSTPATLAASDFVVI